MAPVEDDDRRTAVPPSGTPEPPLQAILPNFDKISRDAFRKGTVSRRRIVIGLYILGGAIAIIAILITYSLL
ncbi:MAG: hypothetical protein IR160_03145 [Salinibacterium sp.]|nr:hypothetical protein [Salinibacterium sp.]MBF0671563.1 hypothetical protein [Salinibacterium sp.]